jgi:hypothetical protein
MVFPVGCPRQLFFQNFNFFLCFPNLFLKFLVGFIPFAPIYRFVNSREYRVEYRSDCPGEFNVFVLCDTLIVSNAMLMDPRPATA